METNKKNTLKFIHMVLTWCAGWCVSGLKQVLLIKEIWAVESRQRETFTITSCNLTKEWTAGLSTWQTWGYNFFWREYDVFINGCCIGRGANRLCAALFADVEGHCTYISSLCWCRHAVVVQVLMNFRTHKWYLNPHRNLRSLQVTLFLQISAVTVQHLIPCKSLHFLKLVQ
jgi:hypothetical protein